MSNRIVMDAAMFFASSSIRISTRCITQKIVVTFLHLADHCTTANVLVATARPMSAGHWSKVVVPNAALILGSALLAAQEMLPQFRHSSHCFMTLGLTYLSVVTCMIMRECTTYGAARHRVAQWICVRQRTSRPVRE